MEAGRAANRKPSRNKMCDL